MLTAVVNISEMAQIDLNWHACNDLQLPNRHESDVGYPVIAEAWKMAPHPKVFRIQYFTACRTNIYYAPLCEEC